MELLLKRVYLPQGTNGTISLDSGEVCHSIELPWRENAVGKSCIPEGRYELVKRISRKYKEHLYVRNVPGRTYILIHPANDAQKELRGCIAPVTTLAGDGIGWSSRKANNKLKALAYEAFDQGEQVFLRITS